MRNLATGAKLVIHVTHPRHLSCLSRRVRAHKQMHPCRWWWWLVVCSVLPATVFGWASGVIRGVERIVQDRRLRTAAAMALQIDQDSLLAQWSRHDDETFHDLTDKEASKIREALLEWYHENRRKLPWRGDPPPYSSAVSIKKAPTKKKEQQKQQQPTIQSFFPQQPNATASNRKRKKPGDQAVEEEEEDTKALPVTGYGVWVSEIMLQQTRVEAVIPYYLKCKSTVRNRCIVAFCRHDASSHVYLTGMKTFPTVHHLANATEEKVNSHWAGLGFYRRARLLHRGAKKVVREWDGRLPTTVEELLEIDGIGRYTASAVASIAFGQCVPVVDGNVCRVLSRLCGIATHIKSPVLKDNLGWKLAAQIVGEGHDQAGDINQALMELGATYCSPSGTGLDKRDPLLPFYLSTRLSEAFLQERRKLSPQSSFPVEAYLEQVSTNTTGVECKLCGGKEGVRQVLDSYSDMVLSASGAVEPLGHGPFPLPPPKTTKREEVLAVGVLAAVSKSKNDNDDDDDNKNTTRWLLIQRPKSGLLAGQWEFPNECLWTSADSKKKDKKKKKEVVVPSIAQETRRHKLTNKLRDVMTTRPEQTLDEDGLAWARRRVLDHFVEHVFSHVRHTMWIEWNVQEMDKAPNPLEWTCCSSDQQVRWMTEQDMKAVGVTSGVKKILAAFKKAVRES